MRRSPYLSGPPSPYRGVALLGLVVLVATSYVACGGNDRTYGQGTNRIDSGAGGDTAGGGNGGGTIGSSGANGGGGGAGKIGGGGSISGGGVGGLGVAGSGSVKDAADDGPLSNAN